MSGRTIRETAKSLVEAALAAARYAGTSSITMRLWVMPGPRGTVANQTGMGSAAFDAMDQAQRAKLDDYLAAVGFVEVVEPVTVEAPKGPAWSEFIVAKAIGKTIARWALGRADEAKDSGDDAAFEAALESAKIATQELEKATVRERARHDQAMAQLAEAQARRQLASPPPAPPGPGEVLQDADYDEHVRLVVDRASAETPRRAVRMLAQAERLLARKGRLTAERGAALAQAFAAVVDRASDARRN